MIMLTCDGSYIMNIETIHIVTGSPDLHLPPRFFTVSGRNSSGQNASTATSKMALHD
jgi:hypothetical protein